MNKYNSITVNFLCITILIMLFQDSFYNWQIILKVIGVMFLLLVFFKNIFPKPKTEAQIEHEIDLLKLQLEALRSRNRLDQAIKDLKSDSREEKQLK